MPVALVDLHILIGAAEADMRSRLSTDFVTGALFIALGGFALVYGSRYAPGTAARMGPGYFPRLISIALGAIGIVLVARSLLAGGEALQRIGWRPLMLVLAGTLGFGFLIDRTGLLPAGVLLVVAARLADRDIQYVETAVLALALTLGAAFLFLLGLGLPIKLLRY